MSFCSKNEIFILQILQITPQTRRLYCTIQSGADTEGREGKSPGSNVLSVLYYVPSAHPGLSSRGLIIQFMFVPVTITVIYVTCSHASVFIFALIK